MYGLNKIYTSKLKPRKNMLVVYSSKKKLKISLLFEISLCLVSSICTNSVFVQWNLASFIIKPSLWLNIATQKAVDGLLQDRISLIHPKKRSPTNKTWSFAGSWTHGSMAAALCVPNKVAKSFLACLGTDEWVHSTKIQRVLFADVMKDTPSLSLDSIITSY